MFTEVDVAQSDVLRPQAQRRVPPDRGIVLLDAKDRIGPKIWALYGKVERPVVLRDDLYLDNAANDFYRDSDGHAFLLLPYASPDAENHFEVADGAYRRAVALGVTERPEIFFTCIYQFQLPEYRCIHIHADKDDEILPAEKCLQLMAFEKLRLLEQMGTTCFTVVPGKKIMPVSFHCANADNNTGAHNNTSAQPSTNLLFALNSLVLHHGYDVFKLQKAWDSV